MAEKEGPQTFAARIGWPGAAGPKKSPVDHIKTLWPLVLAGLALVGGWYTFQARLDAQELAHKTHAEDYEEKVNDLWDDKTARDAQRDLILEKYVKDTELADVIEAVEEDREEALTKLDAAIRATIQRRHKRAGGSDG